MIQPLLSILVPTVVSRKMQLKKLLSRFGKETDMDVFPHCDLKIEFKKRPIEIIIAKDDKQITIGEKRENLYKSASGIYSWQIDDDDDIDDDAIRLILEAIENNPNSDCITFEEHIDIDGKIQRSNHSLKYDDWANNFDGFDYVRTPFFKSVIKTDIAREVPVPHIRFGEDHQWAQLLKPHLKTEVHIDQQLYRYIHRSSDPTERYGLDIK